MLKFLAFLDSGNGESMLAWLGSVAIRVHMLKMLAWLGSVAIRVHMLRFLAWLDRGKGESIPGVSGCRGCHLTTRPPRQYP